MPVRIGGELRHEAELSIVWVCIAAGCGGAAPAPASGGATSAEAPAESAVTAEAATEVGVEPVSWTFFEPLSIDPAGRAHAGGAPLGTFTGEVLADGPEELARLDEQGRVFVRGAETSMRVVGTTLEEDGELEAILRIEGDVLVPSEGDERIPIAHLRADQMRRVLLVCALMLADMARAYQH